MARKVKTRTPLIVVATIIGTSPVWLFGLFVFPGVYWWVANAAFTLFKTEAVVEFEMRWSVEESTPDSGPRRIRLDFVEFPGYSHFVTDNELEKHLEVLGSETVTAGYSATTFLRRTTSFHLVRVGELERLYFPQTSWRQGDSPGPGPFGEPFWWFL